MSWIEALVCILGLLVFLGVVIVGALVVFGPAVSRESERVRVEREAQEASYRIHQQAAQAFGQMLEAAREADDKDGWT